MLKLNSSFFQADEFDDFDDGDTTVGFDVADSVSKEIPNESKLTKVTSTSTILPKENRNIRSLYGNVRAAISGASIPQEFQAITPMNCRT